MRRWIPLATLAIACGTITPPAPPGSPFNRCTASADCAGFGQAGVTCTDGACVLPAAWSGVLVISTPVTSFYAPGQSIVLTSSYLASLFAKQKIPGGCTDSDTRPLCNCRPKGCLFMPVAGGSEGNLQVSRDVAIDIWPSESCALLGQIEKNKLCGLRPYDGNQFTTVPASVVFRPLWSPDAKTFLDARSLGLPVRDIEALVTPRNDAIPGPNNTPGTRYSALLQQSLAEEGVSKYVLRFDPQAPFDGVFPPIVQEVAVKGAQGATEFSPARMTTLDVAKFRFTSLSPDLSGWKVYLATRASAGPNNVALRVGERVSNVATLGATGGEVTLRTDYTDSFGAPRTNFVGLRLVAEPPAGSGQPTYSNDDLAGAILSEHTIPPCADPKNCAAALPPPALVRGVVQREGKGRRARVAFVSQRGDGAGVQLTDGSFPASLSYETVVDSDDTGAYVALLPPGTYDAFVEPKERDVAKTSLVFNVGMGATVQQGKSLALGAPVHVHGTVALADGRPVGDARARLVPAAIQPKGTDPRSLPRAFSVKTVIADGRAHLDAYVDPGVYDIFIEPVEGTKVPWLVSTSHVIREGTSENGLPGDRVELDPFVIAAPSRVGLTLLDPFGNPVTSALVQAFQPSQVPPVNPPNTATQAPFYAVGRTFTDERGHFDLYLGPAPK